MKKIFGMFCVLFVLSCASVLANDAITEETPAALLALGDVQVISVEEAEAIRGETYKCNTPEPPETPEVPETPDFWQDKSFSVGSRSGFATGSVTLFEGLIASFEYNQLSQSFGDNGSETLSLIASGNIGGLTGNLGSSDAGLTWFTAGKSLSETTDFSGDFTQNFAQHFEMPVITIPAIQ